MSPPNSTPGARGRISKIAIGCSLAGLMLAAIGVLGAHGEVIPPIAGFSLLLVGLGLGGLLSLVLGIAARSAGACLLGALPLLVLAGFRLSVPRVPSIHDITTSPEDPPAFLTHELLYPDGAADSRKLQGEAYPDIQPILLAAAPAEAFETIRQRVEAFGWTISRLDRERGTLEAYEKTKLFRFVDDIVIRVRPEGAGSRVDVRSTSRVGRSDFGVNAERIRKLRGALAAR